MISFNKNNKGNYTGISEKGSLVSLYRVQDEYGFKQDHEWKWMIDTGEDKHWAEFSSYSYEDAAEEFAEYVETKFNTQVDYEFGDEPDK